MPGFNGTEDVLMTFSISRFIQSKIIYLTVAGAALGANWWIGAVQLESVRPVPQLPVAAVPDEMNIRPVKDDLLASRAPQTQTQTQTQTDVVANVPAAKPITLPIPTILRSSSEIASNASRKRHDAAPAFEACLPACETRDPMVASVHPLPRQEPLGDFDEADVEPPHRTFVASIVGRSEVLLASAGAASMGAYRHGRSALKVIMDPMR